MSFLSPLASCLRDFSKGFAAYQCFGRLLGFPLDLTQAETDLGCIVQPRPSLAEV